MTAYAGTAKSYFDKLVPFLSAFDHEQIDKAIGVIAEAWQNASRSSRWAMAAARVLPCI
jgi:hypothetical protein